jgi:hypothetical protein
MGTGNSTTMCKMEVSHSSAIFEVPLLIVADAVELECRRLLLPRAIMAHHQQRHVRRNLRWRCIPRRLSRVSPPDWPRVRCVPAPSIPATTAPPTTRAGHCNSSKLLRHTRGHAGNTVCDFPRNRIAATHQSNHSRSHAGSCVHCHVVGYVLQRLHLHQHHPRGYSRQVLVRLDGRQNTVWGRGR